MKIVPGCPVFKVFCKVAGIVAPEATPVPDGFQSYKVTASKDLDIFREPAKTWAERYFGD